MSAVVSSSPPAHAVQFYATGAALAETVAAFVADGLSVDAPAVLIATPLHREQFAAALEARHVDVEAARRSGQLVVLDAAETLEQFMANGAPVAERFRTVVGGVLTDVARRGTAPVRAYGEMVDVLWRTGQQSAALELERMWNELQCEHDFALLCAYAYESFANIDGVPAVCSVHSHVAVPESPPVGAGASRPVEQRVHTLVTEISRRTALETSLRATRDDLEDVLENAPVPIHRVRRDGIICWANRTELGLLGYERSEYVGRHIAEFHVDRDVIDDILARLIRGEPICDREARVRAKDGSIRHFVISSNVQHRDGLFLTTRCFSRDVTEAKRAEADRTAMFEAITALASELDLDRLVHGLVNRALELCGADVVAFASADGTCVDSARVDPAAAPRFPRSSRIIAEVLRATGPVGSNELTEDPGVASFLGVPIATPRATLGALMVGHMREGAFEPRTIQLVSALAANVAKAIENARLFAAERAARQAKDQFIAMLGHELRNPLAPILTAVQLMRIRGEAPREQEVIERQVKHLTCMVDDLLDVSRIARGEIEIEKKPINLRTLLARTIEISSSICEQRGHRLEVAVPDGDIWIEGDETRLCQVLTNLLTNAAKYTDRPGTIEVRVMRHSDRVEIAVRDNGAGISPELLPRVFEPFVQGERSTDRSRGGLGVGLTIVRTLVGLHGGSVRAASEGRGKGSEFIVTLPILAVEARPDPATARERGFGKGVHVTPKRILVVDDNEDAATMISEVLRSLGHDVVLALDGPRALEAVKTFEPEVAVLDIGLPVMDGFELAAALRSTLGGAVRMFALTGYGQAEDRERSEAAGFERHFVKPVAMPQLLAAIEIAKS